MLPQDPLVLQPVSEAVVHAEVAGQLEGIPVLVALDPALQAVADVLEASSCSAISRKIRAVESSSNLSLPSHFVADLQLTEPKSSVLSFYILVPSFLFKFST